jgi:hypothetical protein
MNEPRIAEAYCNQLADWVASFAAGRYQDFEGALDDSCTPLDVKRFLINSFGNRYTWLIRETSSLDQAFNDLPALVKAYIRAMPRTRYNITAPADEERFLIWLAQTQTLTPAQRDFITCQRGEYAVGTEARRNRSAHLHFQKLGKHAVERGARFGEDARLRTHLNPIRFAGELLTSLFTPGAKSLPVGVLFYAAGASVCAALLEETAKVAVGELSARGPCTLEEWSKSIERRGASPPVSRTELLRLAQELTAQGLVAFD